MLSQAEQAAYNLEQARQLRVAGCSYREIRQTLSLTASQLSRIRRILSRSKAAQTRLHNINPDATARDMPIMQAGLPVGLRQTLKKAGFHTLGDVADSLADPHFAGLENLPGIGAHRAQLIKRLLELSDLLPEQGDLQSAIEALFPEFQHSAPL